MGGENAANYRADSKGGAFMTSLEVALLARTPVETPSSLLGWIAVGKFRAQSIISHPLVDESRKECRTFPRWINR
jgi:hypothetical protein